MKWLGKFPDPFLAEIGGQPEALRRAARGLTEQLDTLEALGGAMAERSDVVFTGMGASYDACYPAVNELAAHGVLALQIDTAELLHFRSNVLTPSTVLVIVSQSGESAEVVRLLAALEQRAARPVTVSVTNGSSNPVAERADLRLDTRAGPEQGPSTMTFAASIAQLAAVACVVSGEAAADAVVRARAASEEASVAVERILADEAVVAPLEAALGDDALVVLARGPARAAAEMGALTLKECGVVAEAYETATFRHGPFELAGPGLAAIVIATEPETSRLDRDLAADLVETGASVALLWSGDGAPDGAVGIGVAPVDRLLSSTVSIVPIQLLAWRLATARGRVPGVYTRASKVTTRE